MKKNSGWKLWIGILWIGWAANCAAGTFEELASKLERESAKFDVEKTAIENWKRLEKQKILQSKASCKTSDCFFKAQENALKIDQDAVQKTAEVDRKVREYFNGKEGLVIDTVPGSLEELLKERKDLAFEAMEVSVIQPSESIAEWRQTFFQVCLQNYFLDHCLSAPTKSYLVKLAFMTYPKRGRRQTEHNMTLWVRTSSLGYWRALFSYESQKIRTIQFDRDRIDWIQESRFKSGLRSMVQAALSEAGAIQVYDRHISSLRRSAEKGNPMVEVIVLSDTKTDF